MEVVDAQFTIKPKDFIARLQAVYGVSPEESVQIITDLVEDTFNLIELHLPEVNVIRLREIFRYQRPIWENSPPFLSGVDGD